MAIHFCPRGRGALWEAANDRKIASSDSAGRVIGKRTVPLTVLQLSYQNPRQLGVIKFPYCCAFRAEPFVRLSSARFDGLFPSRLKSLPHKLTPRRYQAELRSDGRTDRFGCRLVVRNGRPNVSA